MNKGSTKLLVIVGLIVLLACSWYMLINETAKTQGEYNQHLTVAREKVATGLHQVALENFEKARAIQDSIALRDEMAQVYKDFGNVSLYEEFCEQIRTDYPYEKLGYERLADLYNTLGDYSLVFSIKKSAEKRGVESEAINQLAANLEFAFSKELLSAVEIKGFSAGYCAVLRDKGFWGLLNERGKSALSFGYVKVSDYANGLVFAETKSGDYVLVDRSGKIVSRVADGRKVEDCSALNSGLMAVKYDGKYHYCDDSFKEVFGAYDYAGVFNGGVAAVSNGGKWAVVNEKGEQITDFVFDDIKMDDVRIAFRSERAFAKQGGAYILIDNKGKQVGTGSWEDADAFGNTGIAAVKKDGKWGYVDTEGNEVVPCQYQDAKSFNGDMAAVMVNGKWGYISKTDFALKIDATFDEARDFTNKGTAFVRENTQWYILSLYRLA